MARLRYVLQNRSLVPLLMIFSIANLSGAAYIASSTFIYQNGFHLSEQAYSFYFSLNALGMISGPMIYLRLYRRFNTETILRGCFMFILIAGALVLLFGNTAPWIFALCILPSSIAGSCSRAPSTNLMLEQQQGDTGSVSSVIGCTGLLMGSLGMTLISLPWGNMIVALGVMILITSSTTLVFFPLAMKGARRPLEPELQLAESPE
jgi:DHA1 family bicyclomycin/chloramphenicol resistance-like MFS transporter